MGVKDRHARVKAAQKAEGARKPLCRTGQAVPARALDVGYGFMAPSAPLSRSESSPSREGDNITDAGSEVAKENPAKALLSWMVGISNLQKPDTRPEPKPQQETAVEVEEEESSSGEEGDVPEAELGFSTTRRFALKVYGLHYDANFVDLSDKLEADGSLPKASLDDWSSSRIALAGSSFKKIAKSAAMDSADKASSVETPFMKALRCSMESQIEDEVRLDGKMKIEEKPAEARTDEKRAEEIPSPKTEIVEKPVEVGSEEKTAGKTCTNQNLYAVDELADDVSTRPSTCEPSLHAQAPEKKSAGDAKELPKATGAPLSQGPTWRMKTSLSESAWSRRLRGQDDDNAPSMGFTL